MVLKNYRGSWELFTGANAPLYISSDTRLDKTFNVDFTVSYYLSLGLPSDKLILGFAAYGRSWTLANSDNTGMTSTATGPGYEFNVSHFISNSNKVF